MELSPGMQLAQELAQAIITDDDAATKVALVNIVGNVLDSLSRLASAQERIAETVEAIVIRKETIHTFSSD